MRFLAGGLSVRPIEAVDQLLPARHVPVGPGLLGEGVVFFVFLNRRSGGFFILLLLDRFFGAWLVGALCRSPAASTSASPSAFRFTGLVVASTGFLVTFFEVAFSFDCLAFAYFRLLGVTARFANGAGDLLGRLRFLAMPPASAPTAAATLAPFARFFRIVRFVLDLGHLAGQRFGMQFARLGRSDNQVA